MDLSIVLIVALITLAIVAIPLGIMIGASRRPSPGGAGQQPAGNTAGGAAARRPFWKSKLFLVVIGLLVVGIATFILYQMFAASRTGSGATAALPWDLVFLLFTIGLLFLAGFILFVLGKAGGRLLIVIAAVLLSGMLIVNWLGSDSVASWGRQTGADLVNGTFGSPRTVADLCPKEVMVVLQPGVPYTHMRDQNCSTSKRLLWQGTIGTSSIHVTTDGTAGVRTYNWIPGRVSSFSYPGVVEEVTMKVSHRDEPATVWFVYKK